MFGEVVIVVNRGLAKECVGVELVQRQCECGRRWWVRSEDVRTDCGYQNGDGNCGGVVEVVGIRLSVEVVVGVPCMDGESVEACGQMVWFACGSQVVWSSQDNWSSVAPMLVEGQVVDLVQASCLVGHSP